MPVLFEKSQINNMTLENRFVRSATWEGLAEKNGAVTDRLVACMEDLVRGGVGLIVSGHAYVIPEGQVSPYQMGIYADDLKPGLKKMTQAVHALGGRIVAQLAHGGGHASEKLIGCKPLGPSVLGGKKGPLCREMTLSDIGAVVKGFALAAKRARECGFDGVQIHAAHGYLISEFLSPTYNKRKDAYGGSLENRARLLMEVYRAIRENTGQDFCVCIKINSSDFTEDGFSPEEMVEVSLMLEKAGIDAVELSGGVPLGPPNRSTVRSGKEGSIPFYLDACTAYRKRVGVPLMVVGGIRTLKAAELIIGKNIADYVALCRPLIREPGLVSRWKNGDTSQAGCVSCNKCFKPALMGKGIFCLEEKKDKAKE